MGWCIKRGTALAAGPGIMDPESSSLVIGKHQPGTEQPRVCAINHRFTKPKPPGLRFPCIHHPDRSSGGYELSSIGKRVVTWLFIHRQEVFAVASQPRLCLVTRPLSPVT